MGQSGLYLRRWRAGERGGFIFFCPGCKRGHSVQTDAAGGWTFNGDMSKPTFGPSVKVSDESGVICHSFVTAGEVQFLNDCAHGLAGKIVPLPELPDHLKD